MVPFSFAYSLTVRFNLVNVYKLIRSVWCTVSIHLWPWMFKNGMALKMVIDFWLPFRPRHLRDWGQNAIDLDFKRASILVCSSGVDLYREQGKSFVTYVHPNSNPSKP